jgi:hypothetical protein
MSLNKIESIIRILINIFKKEFYILLKLFISKKIFFIKIGASEANIKNDVLAKFINIFNCQGVLIEPNPIYFDKIKKNYSKRFTCLKLAISNKNALRNLFTIIETNPLLNGKRRFTSDALWLYTNNNNRLAADGLDMLYRKSKAYNQPISKILDLINTYAKTSPQNLAENKRRRY